MSISAILFVEKSGWLLRWTAAGIMNQRKMQFAIAG